jgi:hypothetical protein
MAHHHLPKGFNVFYLTKNDDDDNDNDDDNYYKVVYSV